METIFDFIVKQKSKYTQPVELADGWSWSMKEHLKQSFLYINSQFNENNDNRFLRPFKNIILPILNIEFRTEGFDVKDIELYVDNPDEYFKSLLIKKYHDKWALENQIDTFIDEVVESYCTYGGVLVRKTKQAKPEVIDLKSLAFCNQHDILNNPFGILHQMSFAKLRSEAKKRGWGGEGADIDVETLIQLVKRQDKDFVEIFEVHGSMPIEWIDGDEIVNESKEDINQIQIVAFYVNENHQEQGVCLFKKKMPELPFKLLKRDDIQNRALGRGGVEELFESQIWTNWDTVKSTEMLNSASKTLFFSDDPTLKNRNNLTNVENNQILNLQEGRTIQQLDTFPRNLAVFNDSIERFWQHAQILGSAPEALMGEEPNSGTPFKLYEAQQIEGKGMHKYRQGKLATFMDEIYRDWILPHLATEIVKEQVFMQELSADEMQAVTEQILTKKTNEFKKRMILGMQDINEDLVNAYKEQVKIDVSKEGNKKFFKILKDEMKDISISVMTNIAGKQKNLALLTDKLVNVLRQYIATPQIRQDPEMAKLLNTILESSGLSPIMFSPPPAQAMAQPQAGTMPMQQANQQQV
jgi:hypothetical protein